MDFRQRSSYNLNVKNITIIDVKIVIVHNIMLTFLQRSYVLWFYILLKIL